MMWEWMIVGERGDEVMLSHQPGLNSVLAQ